MTWVLVGLFGAVGALARYWVSGVVQRRWPTRFPAGTLVVNLTGALAAGLLVGLAAGRGVSDTVLLTLGVGFLGGYTTFSTWMVETVLAERSGGSVGAWRGAVNLTVTLFVGIGAAAVAYGLGRAL